MVHELATTKDVIRALGDKAVVAAMVGASYETVCNWARANHFPPKTFVALQRAMAERGIRAPIELWGMVALVDSDDSEGPSA